MKIFAISDLHLSSQVEKPMDIFGSSWDNHWEKISNDWDSRVGDDDIVLIGGDISWAMKLEDAKYDLEKIADRKGIKVMIRGNHDYWWSSLSKVKSILPPKMYVIQNDAIRFDGLVVCGSRGWSVPETGITPADDDAKLYERERIRLEMSLQKGAKIRKEGDHLAVMLHFPPFNSRFESSHYTDLIAKYQASFVIYGHLHGEVSRSKMEFVKNDIPYFLTSCDKLQNKLWEWKERENEQVFIKS